tara:strand:- start:1698 stop:2396 length:699 start_codon:yes stop_codon:yes gene_type:complete
MNQIISQHGWGLDQSMWNKVKEEFIRQNWIWQDNNRGYYSDPHVKVNWIKDDSENNKKVVICHSLGIHLIGKEILREASHIVLINSFYNFIPSNNESKITMRTLLRMEKKINSGEVRFMLEEFISRSFMPNQVDIKFKSIFNLKSKQINLKNLLKDFQKLYLQKSTFSLFSKNTDILVIKSKNDLILKDYASDEFVYLLNNSQINKPKLVQIEGQGHLIDNSCIVKILKDWL